MPIRERAGQWHYRFYVHQKEFTGSTDLAATKRNKNAAMRIEAEKRRLVLEGKESQLKLQVVTFSDAAKQFLEWTKGEYAAHPNSAKRIGTSFVSLCRYFEKTPLLQITAGSLDDFKSWRRSKHEVRDVTIRHDLHALSTFFQYAKKHNWCRDNPTRDEEFDIPSDADSVRIYVLTPEDERAYFAAAGRFPNLYDLGRLMLLQGCRPEELMSLEQASIDLAGGVFRILRGKSKAARRELRMTPESKLIFEKRLMSPGRFVFPGKKHGTHLSKLNCSHGKILEATKLQFVPYDLRHTFATRLVTQAGVDLATAAAILGHSNLRSIQKYIHIGAPAMAVAMDKYSKLFDTKEQAKEKTVLQ
jgi:integrase